MEAERRDIQVRVLFTPSEFMAMGASVQRGTT